MSSAATVIASVAVAITASASGAQNGLCSDGSLVSSPPAASHLALGVPPTQKISASLVLSACQYWLKSSLAMIGLVSTTRSAPKWPVNTVRSRLDSASVLNVDGAASEMVTSG